jgi:hypothetical protein
VKARAGNATWRSQLTLRLRTAGSLGHAACRFELGMVVPSPKTSSNLLFSTFVCVCNSRCPLLQVREDLVTDSSPGFGQPPPATKVRKNRFECHTSSFVLDSGGTEKNQEAHAATAPTADAPEGDEPVHLPRSPLSNAQRAWRNICPPLWLQRMCCRQFLAKNLKVNSLT